MCWIVREWKQGAPAVAGSCALRRYEQCRGGYEREATHMGRLGSRGSARRSGGRGGSKDHFAIVGHKKYA